MNKVRNLFAAVSLITVMAIPALGLGIFTSFVSAASGSTLDITGNIQCGNEFQAINGSCEPTGSSKSIEEIAIDIVNIFSWLVGVVSVIMIIYGGFKYITSAGNETKVKSAMNTILYAIIGLVVVALSQVIVRFVVSKVGQE